LQRTRGLIDAIGPVTAVSLGSNARSLNSAFRSGGRHTHFVPGILAT
jgi:hypothetical protein